MKLVGVTLPEVFFSADMTLSSVGLKKSALLAQRGVYGE